MMKRKMIVILGLLGLFMAVLTACSTNPSKNADGTPSTLKSCYMGQYSSDTDNAYFFQENTNEFDFDVKKSTISDGSGDDFYTKKYSIVDEDKLKPELQGQAQKYKNQANKTDVIFYISIEEGATYQIILSNDGKNIKIIALDAVYEYGDNFIFTGTAKE